ncbi:hypothetical protein IHQ71_03645 [Rhizobium sp. TH2]|uniref:hypothetical protein n=1 Tax=Rhizobium sp. TH2 TaxID=2775403 RepID=UPI002157A8F5|nr:hypothetical protein [Rhizobium sp. TH2]UVC09722.1 hypothetical protein IHQ71_03645 [Rhizobium sp. TH2]
MKKADVDALVLVKVNAPHSKVLDANEIAFLLTNPMEMRTAIGPMSTFFYELDGDLQKCFAEFHNVPISSLEAALTLFDQWSGARRIVASGT